MAKTPRINNAPNPFGHSFWKTTKPPAGDYEPEDDHGAVYYGQKVVDVNYNEPGDALLSHKAINEFGYFYNLHKNSYLEEGSVAACFELNGQLYTWNVGPKKEEEIFIACHKYMDNEQGTGNVSRLDPETAEVLWTIDLGEQDYQNGSNTVTRRRKGVASAIDPNGNIYIGWNLQSQIYANGQYRAGIPVGGITKITSKGTVKWTITLGIFPAISTIAAGNFPRMDIDSHNHVYFSSVTDTEGTAIFKVDPDGNIVKRIHRSIFQSSYSDRTSTVCGSLLIDIDDNIWYGSNHTSDSRVPNSKLDPDGNLIWQLSDLFPDSGVNKIYSGETKADILQHSLLSLPHKRNPTQSSTTHARAPHIFSVGLKKASSIDPHDGILQGQFNSLNPNVDDLFYHMNLDDYYPGKNNSFRRTATNPIDDLDELRMFRPQFGYVTEAGMSVMIGVTQSPPTTVYNYKQKQHAGSLNVFARPAGTASWIRGNGYEFNTDEFNPGYWEFTNAVVVAGGHLWFGAISYQYTDGNIQTYRNLLKCNEHDGTIIDRYVLGDIVESDFGLGGRITSSVPVVYHLNSRVIN